MTVITRHGEVVAGMAASFSNQFRLSITKALGDQLAEELAKLTPAPLTQVNLDELDRRAVVENLSSRSGVYQLYRQTEADAEPKLVYVGKAEKPLPQRLGNHLKKISGRTGISLDEMTFKCLFVAEDFTAVAPEKLLIKQYKKDGHIPWNTNGFGNKDPGRNRDRTVLKKNHFDVLFGIDLERKVEGLVPGEQTLEILLAQIKNLVPYNFRYEESVIYQDVAVSVPDGPMTADQAFRLVATCLPEGWQVAALMGYVIMYRDSQADYASAWRYYRGLDVHDAQPKLKPAGKIKEEPVGSDADDSDADG
ncbi:GIY-YIG nuclease family protein [Streptomyces sp. NPDC088745]|uniref:GIY-YIG nuclease family protein n=1 Tax=Streptomyces sp. NPDC088745 TaxID=3365884 RepID=UPI0038031541